MTERVIEECNVANGTAKAGDYVQVEVDATHGPLLNSIRVPGGEGLYQVQRLYKKFGRVFMDCFRVDITKEGPVCGAAATMFVAGRSYRAAAMPGLELRPYLLRRVEGRVR